MKLLSLFILCCATLTHASLPNQPAPPNLTFLFSANITAGARVAIGPTASGQRVIVPINGGSFSGPKLKGKILLGLASVAASGGIATADATYVLQTDDGANIVVTEKAILPNIEILFATGSGTYAWLNNITAWATGTESNGQASLDFWQIGT